MNTYIAMLADHGALSEPIYWRTTSIAEAREYLANVGAWQGAPESGDPILLSDGAHVWIWEDTPPFTSTDDLAARVEGVYPRLVFSIGPRGGIKREAA